MPARKMRVELFDTEGNRYAISFEGQITRDKALRLLDLVELLGGVPGSGNPVSNTLGSGSELSKYDKVRMIVQRHFPIGWFSSREVQALYEEDFKEPIGLSTVATYLSRMAARGIALKTGNSNNVRYKIPSLPQAVIRKTP